MTERDYVGLAADYQADVLAGRILACQWVRLACERNRRDLDRQHAGAVYALGEPSKDFPFRFDPEAARRICRMAEMLPHIKGPKAKIIGRDEDGRAIWNTIQLEPWQCWYLTSMFGWLHVRTGLRRFRVSMLLVPRKNAKSTIAAIIVLYMLTSDGESGAECYSAATTRDQAKVVAEIAWEMAKRSPAFCEYFGVRVGAKTTYTLTVPGTASKFAPLSADAHTLDGLNISLAIIDELHAHKTRQVWAVVDTATGARPQPYIVITTTAGVEIGGICHEKMSYLHKILDGTVSDEAFFGINYTIDDRPHTDVLGVEQPADDYRLPLIHRKANPNYGVSVDPDDLIRKVSESQHSPAAINDFLTKHTNVWVRSESGWMTATQWQTCAKSGLTIEDLKGFPCWIGVDLGEVRDTSALTLLFQTGPNTWALIPKIYLPADAIAQSPIAEMSGWVREGHLIETLGSEADYHLIEEALLGFCDTLKVQEIDFDRRSARLMMQDIKKRLEPKLGRDGVDRFVIDVPQDITTMDPAMTTTSALVEGQRIQHDGNPVMAWMIANVVIELNHKGEKYPRKAGGKDSANKIDAPVAFFTCLSRAIAALAREPLYQMFFAGSSK